MPASEETYRSQPTLHLIFAISSIAMLLSTVWMVMADHLREWKRVQREFHVVEHDKLAAEQDKTLKEQKAKNAAQISAIDAKIAAAQQNAAQRTAKISQIDRELNGLIGTVDRLETGQKFQKADLDSKRSFYDGMVDRREEDQAREYLRTVVQNAEKRLASLSKDVERAKDALKAKQTEKEELLGHVDNLKSERDKLTREGDRLQRLIEQKDAQYFGLRALVRGLPLLDFMAPPTKIEQISLPDLTINYNFKEVPRYDRCQTCHQGIGKANYEKDAHGGPMARVFRSHPFLKTGAKALDPHGKIVDTGLYLADNGPHPINSFGCTICHGGQGSGTDFTYASHTPNSIEEEEEWMKKYGWRDIHFWDFPMLPTRFVESSCLKCHHMVADVPQAKKLQAGYQRIVTYGCTGCHQIGGEGIFGPDLSDERMVGPNLSHVASKDAKDWVLKWITDPHAFRPDSRMPRFYGVTNNNGKEDWPKNYAEIHAIAHYLFTRSTPPKDFVDPPAKTDPKRGKELFLQKGCLACHQHRPYSPDEVQLADRDAINPDYKLDAAATYDPKGFPTSVRDLARADYGPNLSNIAAKFASKPDGQKWLTNWINSPDKYHPKSLMPNLQLSLEDAADIASWLLSVPAEWPVKVEVAPLESKEVQEAIDDLVKLYVTKANGFKKQNGEFVSVALSEVDDTVANKLKPDEKLYYLGEKTISRLGCFGCHTIPGFENAKPIGTPLFDWGIKSPARLDFGHIIEYLADQQPDDNGNRDGTDPFYLEKVNHESRIGFLYQKLHRPRSYDYRKKSETYKTWDDRLRMPQFAWANDRAAVEEVMTFVLGLTGEKIGARYLPANRYKPAQMALAQGAKVLNRYNCAGCHVLEMPKFKVPGGIKVADVFTDFKTNLRSSYQARATDYLELYPGITYDPTRKLGPDDIESELGLAPDDGAHLTEDGSPLVLEGMPIDLFENVLTVQLWQPITIRGYTFNVGDNIALDQTRVEKIEANGGNFARLYSTYQSERTNTPLDTFWNRLPPPLLREGNKVQTPWLSAFLKDPHPLRPAVQLRMPRFHYGKTPGVISKETEQVADYFAARDRADFPYQLIPEQAPAYLEEREKGHPNYLAAGWEMMTNKASPCIQCHAIGKIKPTGGAQVVNGPDLRGVAPRFRPEYLEAWIGNPRRLVPYTAMPQNVAPRAAVQIPVPKTFENKPLDMVRAIRDTLLNYVNAVELQLAAGGSPSAPAEAAPRTNGTLP
jgi:cbb3-type cytochrome oxidase cytochrome c subunit/peptidoglycan hydrolase CwlO-like protein